MQSPFGQFFMIRTAVIRMLNLKLSIMNSKSSHFVYEVNNRFDNKNLKISDTFPKKNVVISL